MHEANVMSFEPVTASGIVCETPCFVYSICGIGIADSDNVYSIYNGQNAEGKRKMRLVAGEYSADFRLFACPVFFSKGLYVEFTTSGAEVEVQFLPVLPPKDM